MNLLPKEINYNIFNYINTFDDIINIKYLSKYYNKLFESFYDGIIFMIDFNDSFSYLYYSKILKKNKYFKNLIIINSVSNMKHLDLTKISYINITSLNTFELINEDYLFYNTFLNYCNQIKYLEIIGLDFPLPKNLINLEDLRLYNCYIQYIPKEYINLKRIFSINDLNYKDITYIPKNIMLNLEYLDIKYSYLKHDIYLNKNKILHALFGLNYENENIKIYLVDENNIILKNNLKKIDDGYFEYIEYNN